MSIRIKPLLPLNPTLRQRAIAVATRLMTELMKGGQYRVPVAKYAYEICKLFSIPLLPGESAVAVAAKKLQAWRAQVSFRMVADEDIESVLPQLEIILGTIRQAIASKLSSRQQRKKANSSRPPKHRHMPNTRPLDLPPADPYAD